MSRNRTLLVAAASLVASSVFAANPKPDIENGKTVFSQQCGICHAVTDEPGGPTQGPNLVGLIGRKAASDKDFPSYTAALKAYGVTWNAKNLSDFLINPMAKVPGTMMPMILPDDKIRADVVAYLASLKK